jgi:hypothetical protein
MNNYERIKQMSVDEMVKFIVDTATTCEYCRARSLCNVNNTCQEAYKQWLLQECE